MKKKKSRVPGMSSKAAESRRTFVRRHGNPSLVPERIEEQEDGSMVVKLSPEMGEWMQEYMALSAIRFKEKFGREIRGDDPLFWDEDADTPQRMSEAKLRRIFIDGLVGIGRSATEAMDMYEHIGSEEHFNSLYEEVE